MGTVKHAGSWVSEAHLAWMVALGCKDISLCHWWLLYRKPAARAGGAALRVRRRRLKGRILILDFLPETESLLEAVLSKLRKQKKGRQMKEFQGILNGLKLSNSLLHLHVAPMGSTIDGLSYSLTYHKTKVQSVQLFSFSVSSSPVSS
jgi:hypothetical protein